MTYHEPVNKVFHHRSIQHSTTDSMHIFTSYHASIDCSVSLCFALQTTKSPCCCFGRVIYKMFGIWQMALHLTSQDEIIHQGDWISEVSLNVVFHFKEFSVLWQPNHRGTQKSRTSYSSTQMTQSPGSQFSWQVVQPF